MRRRRDDLDAIGRLIDPDASYFGDGEVGGVVITAKNHAEAIEIIRNARRALARLREDEDRAEAEADAAR